MNGLLQDAVIRGDVDTVRRLVFDGVDVEGGVIALLILGARRWANFLLSRFMVSLAKLLFSV